MYSILFFFIDCALHFEEVFHFKEACHFSLFASCAMDLVALLHFRFLKTLAVRAGSGPKFSLTATNIKRISMCSRERVCCIAKLANNCVPSLALPDFHAFQHTE